MIKVKNIIFNSFFRTIGRILAVVLISTLFGLIMSKLGFKIPYIVDIVNASEIQSYNNTYMAYKLELDGVSTWYGNYSVGTWHEREQGGFIREFDVHMVGSNTNVFLSSRTYYFEFTLGVTGGSLTTTGQNMYQLLGNPQFKILGSVNASESGATQNNIKSFACGTQLGNGTNRLVVACSFQPNTDIKYFRVAMIYSDNAIWFDEYSYYSMDHFTYDSGVEGAIENQNILIDNGFKNIETEIGVLNETLDTAFSNLENTIESNTEAIINANKVCEFIDMSSVVETSKSLGSNGVPVVANGWGITDYIRINPISTLKVIEASSSTTSTRLCFYNTNKSYISCVGNSTLVVGNELSIPANTSYVRFTINTSINKPQFEICKNGNQATIDYISDDSSPDISSLGDMAGWLPAGPIDSIINLPLTYLQNLNNALSSSCQPIVAELPFVNQNITLPCVKTLYQEMGVLSYLDWIGAIASGFILFKYLMNLYKWVDDTLTFRENNWLDNWGGGE